MSRLCFICKYPPIQGGTSTSTYWHIRALAKKGHQIHVVSNCWEVEESYRQYFTGDDLDFIKDIEFESGGYIRHHFSNPFLEPKFIPYNHPFLSKLASIAIEVVEKFKCEKIVSYYLEPYSVAAFIVSMATGIPYYIRHAGSDITRLYNNPELNNTYKFVMKKASGVLTTPRSFSIVNSIIERKKISIIQADYLPKDFYNNKFPKLNIKDLLESLDDHVITNKLLSWNNGSFDSSKVTLGIYCKAAKNKGILELIEALEKIDNVADKINLVFVTGGNALNNIQERLKKSIINKSCFFIPFLPPWKIPSFINSCDMLFALENMFSVKVHGPRIPLEILACGGCILISDELKSKQFYRNQIQNNKNAIVVHNPRDIAELKNNINNLLNNVSLISEIKEGASKIFDSYDIYSPNEFIEQFENAIGI